MFDNNFVNLISKSVLKAIANSSLSNIVSIWIKFRAWISFTRTFWFFCVQSTLFTLIKGFTNKRNFVIVCWFINTICRKFKIETNIILDFLSCNKINSSWVFIFSFFSDNLFSCFKERTLLDQRKTLPSIIFNCSNITCFVLWIESTRNINNFDFFILNSLPVYIIQRSLVTLTIRVNFNVIYLNLSLQTCYYP